MPLTGSQLRPEAGSPLPEGKVKVKLDHDGAVLEVEEDDVEKVRLRGGGQQGRPSVLRLTRPISTLLSGKPPILRPCGGPGQPPLPQRVQHAAHAAPALRRQPAAHLRRAHHGHHQPAELPLHVL